jgi:hypothetical protein
MVTTMKTLKRILTVILTLAILLTAFILVSGKTYLFKAIWYNFAAIDDYKHFPNDTVATARPQPWAISTAYGHIP